MEQPDPIYLQDVSIDQLIPDPENPRLHSDHQIDLVIESIKNAGFTNPPLIDENFMIIAGHGRLMALQKMGRTTVSCLQSHGLTKAQKNALNIADNSLPLMATWSPELLKVKIESLQEDGYNTKLLGFEDNYLKTILNPEQIPEAGLTDEDAVPEVRPDPITKLGDVWILGNHRLMCGDSTSVDDVDKLMNGQSPNTMVTDPPYGVKYEADWRSKAKSVKPTKRETNSKLQNDDQADWYDAYVLFKGAVAYVWHASAFTDVVMDGLRRAGFEIKQQIIWNKNVHALSRSDYHWKHEPCWYAVKKDADRNWNGGRTQMTVWDIKSVMFEQDKTAHPTQKPVEIYDRPIKFHTNEGEYVYDPFAGSGTSIISCEKLHRRSLSMELDPKYCDVIVKRWQEFTGNEATLESTGQPFKVLGENNG